MAWKSIGAAALALTLTAAAWAEPGDKAAVAQASAQQKAPAKAPKTAAVKAGPTRADLRFKAQQEAMKALAFLDGEWRGPAKLKRKDGWAPMTQTERASLMLDGTVRMVEGRGYEEDGTLSFNVVSLITYEPAKGVYMMRSYSGGGRASDHPLKVTANGFSWEQKSGAKLTNRHEVTVKNGVWTETATRVPAADGKAAGEPEVYVSFAARRLREAGWPSVAAK